MSNYQEVDWKILKRSGSILENKTEGSFETEIFCKNDKESKTKETCERT